MAKKLYKIGALIINSIIIILMALPTGILMRWFNPDPNINWSNTYSFFSLTPLGYGNWFPILTAFIIIISTIILIFTKKSKVPFILTISSLFTSVISMIVFNSMTTTSLIILSFQFISIILQFIYFYK